MASESHDHHANHHDGHDPSSHMGHAHHGGSINAMAVSATLHCLTGCAIGEIVGLIIGTALGLTNLATIGLAIALAFVFGYTLSTLPLLKAGLAIGTALSVVLAADTLSIATMEIVDNVVMAVIPGAMNAGLVNPIFWIGMMIALTVAFFAAYPVNRYLLQKGKGHALTHKYHGGGGPAVTGARRFIPSLSTPTLTAAITAFMLGGLVVAVADQLGAPETAPHSQAASSAHPAP
ncbi:DUF4396 domain-containing protein [Mycolicibacterium mucogenicum]|uniref:DUF4396 domain-containing protein n=1 Tax=Mycolicibacterium mucogenicum TaxID=56689 RepID=UPI002269AF47|nr:DUF4396 domain-containing protein [Mycolicibacterium mucogenicum]MCX8559937.1 DUF4396 domain-containing protein [Mycolicibacterium mucogenicum]